MKPIHHDQQCHHGLKEMNSDQQEENCKRARPSDLQEEQMRKDLEIGQKQAGQLKDAKGGVVGFINEKTDRKPLGELASSMQVWLRKGCQKISNYALLNTIYAGSYGVVFRAQQIQTGIIYAIKRVKLLPSNQFPVTSVREISVLKNIVHDNIIKIKNIAQAEEHENVLYIVLQYVDHQLNSLLKEVSFKENQAKRLMKDLLEGILYMHQRKFLHRDLKTSNLLYSNEGILKICDFGLARKAAMSKMTQEVITMLYRPPELLLGSYNYGLELDIWSIGIIMAEIVLRVPPFQGKTEIQLLENIFKVLGSPTEESWKEVKTFENYTFIKNKKYVKNQLESMFTKKLSPEGIDLLKQLLTPNPKKRISAQKALNHIWFHNDICARQNMPKRAPLNESNRLKRVKLNEQ